MGNLLFPILASLWTVYLILMAKMQKPLFNFDKEENETLKAVMTGVIGSIVAFYVFNLATNFNIQNVGATSIAVIIMVLQVYVMKKVREQKEAGKLKRIVNLQWVLVCLSALVMYVHLVIFNLLLE